MDEFCIIRLQQLNIKLLFSPLFSNMCQKYCKKERCDSSAWRCNSKGRWWWIIYKHIYQVSFYALTVVCYVYNSAICLLGVYEQWLWPCPTRSYLVLPVSERASKYFTELIKYLTNSVLYANFSFIIPYRFQ